MTLNYAYKYIYNITELDVDLQQYCEYTHIDTIGCVVEKF